jgi:hypothetical protein
MADAIACRAGARREGGEGVPASFAAVFENAAQLTKTAGEPFLLRRRRRCEGTVSRLIRDIGLEPEDVGALDQAGNIEAFACRCSSARRW